MTVIPNSSRTADKDRPDSVSVQKFHQNSDVDGSPKAQHHTLGPGPNQAAPGNHSHDGGPSATLPGYSNTTHNHDAAYSPVSHTHTVPSGTLKRVGSVSRNSSTAASGSELNVHTVTLPGTSVVGRTYRVTGSVSVVPAGGTAPITTDVKLRHGAGAVVGGTVFAATQIQHAHATFAQGLAINGEFQVDAASTSYNVVLTILASGGGGTRTGYGTSSFISWLTVDEVAP